MWLESEPGRGGKFYFTIQFEIPEKPREEAPVPADAPLRNEDVRILLVEDNHINQIVTLRILEKRGFHVLVANNGREALQILPWAAVDVVLMDLQMPDMDGFEAVRRIREEEKKTGGHLPILALTAHAMDGDRQKCLRAGMDGYLAKPVRSGELCQSIEQLLSRPKPEPEVRTSDMTGSAPAMPVI